jgi:hypothetical protein
MKAQWKKSLEVLIFKGTLTSEDYILGYLNALLDSGKISNAEKTALKMKFDEERQKDNERINSNMPIQALHIR